MSLFIFPFKFHSFLQEVEIFETSFLSSLEEGRNFGDSFLSSLHDSFLKDDFFSLAIGAEMAQLSTTLPAEPLQSLNGIVVSSGAGLEGLGLVEETDSEKVEEDAAAAASAEVVTFELSSFLHLDGGATLKELDGGGAIGLLALKDVAAWLSSLPTNWSPVPRQEPILAAGALVGVKVEEDDASDVLTSIRHGLSLIEAPFRSNALERSLTVLNST